MISLMVSTTSWVLTALTRVDASSTADAAPSTAAVAAVATVLVGALAALAGAVAAFCAAAALYRMQKDRVTAGVVTTFSRSLLVIFALMMLAGFASLGTLVPSPQMYMAFLGGGAITALVALASMGRRSP